MAGESVLTQGVFEELACHAIMVVEVTSYDADTGLRDRVEKPRAYAETGTPSTSSSTGTPARSRCARSRTGCGTSW